MNLGGKNNTYLAPVERVPTLTPSIKMGVENAFHVTNISQVNLKEFPNWMEK